MRSFRNSQESRATAHVVILATVFVCLICIATWADEHIVQPVNGDYSAVSFADQILIKYEDRGNGTLSLYTQAAGYNEDFYLGAGSFSGAHAVDAYSLSREIQLSGGGEMHALTDASGTVIEVAFAGSYMNLSQSLDFGNGGDLPGVAVYVDFHDPVPAWIEIFCTGDNARIRSFAQVFGLSEAQATGLYQSGIVGLIGTLSRAGYSPAEVVNLALTRSLDYVRELVAKLETPYVPSPVDKAARKFGIPWGYANTLFREANDQFFSSAVGNSSSYTEFTGNLMGWAVTGTMPAEVSGMLAGMQPAGGGAVAGMLAPSITSKAGVRVGEPIRLAFKVVHPTNPELVFTDPWLKPYLSLVRVEPDGSMIALSGYYGYVVFQLNPRTGEYFSYIDTLGLRPGRYYAYLSVRNPKNDIDISSRVELEIREPIRTYCWQW